MSSRKYNKRIEFFEQTPVSNGFGGEATTETSLGSSWAKIETYQAGKYRNLEDFGVIEPNRAILVTLRKRNDLDYTEKLFFKYRGKSYTISTTPTNVNFNDKEIVFLAVES